MGILIFIIVGAIAGISRGAVDMALIWTNGPWEVWINNCGPGVK